MRGGGEVQ